MEMLLKIKKLTLQYISGLILALIIGILFGTASILFLGWYCTVFLPSPPSPHAYDDFIGGRGGFTGLLVGIPLGACLGVMLADKLFFKSVTHYILGTIIGFMMSIICSIFICLGVPFILGEDVFDSFPFIVEIGLYIIIPTLFALIGYNTIELFARKKKAV